ncbi:MAG: GxxExxY protein [Proteobacteria bacterium]|nr:GxxExxY protein [Pseudomonadota bacterium]
MPEPTDTLTGTIIDATIQVRQTLGPGFLEGVYHRALLIELKKHDLDVESEKEVEVLYEDELVGRHRLDVVVNGEVIVELKTVEALSKAHYAQVRSYVRATGLKVALLVNVAMEKADFRRIENE